MRQGQPHRVPVSLQPEEFLTVNADSVTDTIDRDKIELAAQVLRGGASVRLRVWGTSMLPAIWPGDLVSIESAAPDSLVPGDLVLILQEGRFLLHRLIGRTQDEDEQPRWITRGDSMPQNDPPAATPELVGRVSRIHGRRHLPLNGQPTFLGSISARILCHCNLVRSLALRTGSRWRDWFE